MTGKLKIIDFGFAKQESPLTKLLSGIGTPHFCGITQVPLRLTALAPEVQNKREPYTNSVDMWSVGCVVFFMLSAKLPFGDDADIQVGSARRS